MLREERDALAAKVEALTILAQEEERDFTEEEQSQIDSIIGAEENQGELADINAKIKREERLDEIRRDIAASRGQQAIVPNVVPGEINMKTVTVPAKAKKRGAVKSFVGPDAEKEAYLSGLFYQAAFTGNQDAKNKLDGYGIQMAQTTYDNTAGGFLVPDILETNLIRLVEQYGIARQECRVMPMGVGGTFSVPRRAGGYTAYFVGENAAGTESDLSFDQIQLEAKKMMVLSRWSSELPEDAAVQLGDLITQEIAYAFANKEDDCLWNGDGTSTYGGIVGAANALAAGSIIDTASNIDTFAEITIATFEDAIGQLPKYAGISPKWFVHQSCWANVMQRLAMAAGGNTVQNFEGGVGMSFLGYPVVISQVLQSGAPSDDISGNIFAYFGDLNMASTLGDKRGVTVATDSSVYFTSDAIALKATERFDINVHERGTATAAGPLIALRANAS
jgi:HK97 family phage major capsid protein